MSDDWQPIETAPKDGSLVQLGWLPNDTLDHKVMSRWRNGRWQGNWTPTHWKAPIDGPDPINKDAADAR